MSIKKTRSKLLIIGLALTVSSVLAYQYLSQSEQSKVEGSQSIVSDENTRVDKVKSESAVKRNQLKQHDNHLTNQLASSKLNKSASKQADNANPEISADKKVAPADHDSSHQAQHHGHEHHHPRRHPEDNSIMPPGEPKKPLPKIKGDS